MTSWLGRWRIDGVNWEGRQWFLAPGGVALARELNELWPDGTAVDGTVASKGHDANNPSSDHRPYPHDESPAVVRAIDAGEKVENDGQELFDLLLATRDPRIKYVLHENKIFSSYSRSHRAAWEVQEGSYGHPGHVHVSFTSLADTDDSPWNLEGEDMPSVEDIWQHTIPDQDDGVGRRGVAHGLKQAWSYSKRTYDLVRNLETSGLTEAQIDAIAERVADKLHDRLAS